MLVIIINLNATRNPPLAPSFFLTCKGICELLMTAKKINSIVLEARVKEEGFTLCNLALDIGDRLDVYHFELPIEIYLKPKDRIIFFGLSYQEGKEGNVIHHKDYRSIHIYRGRKPIAKFDSVDMRMLAHTKSMCRTND